MRQYSGADLGLPVIEAPEDELVVGRIRTAGKFFFAGDEKFQVNGVCYGPFAEPGEDEYGTGREMDRDFRRVRAIGCNAIRTYTLPSRRLLDLAAERGLRVLAGIPWEQHVAFLDDRGLRRRIESRVGSAARALAGHPAVLGCAVGNEIPGPVVRWHGRRRMERFLKRLCLIVKEVDPDLPVTYANYPTTEYLRLGFLDFVSMNLYLEDRGKLAAYLARLQHLSGNRPLLVSEAGLDSRSHGLSEQARMAGWQVREAFAAGAAGIFVFSWSDLWWRGGASVTGWDFGLVDRMGRAKPALAAVGEAFAEGPFPRAVEKPLFSVVVCVFNGEECIGRCLEGVRRLRYPRFEVIVVDDGSSDGTNRILEAYADLENFTVVRTDNGGLSRARNLGISMAKGELVAFLDADAWPDADWLSYLERHFSCRGDAGVGGPNIAPDGQGLVARCVAMAPGGPVHVMVSDREAEHLPGCNMAFRKSSLEAIGGFDPRFRVAGDDVDLCWRLQERGEALGFCPAAVVWHESRPTIRGYWAQQRGYGRAEAALEFKWPEKYNALGHLTWRGRVYDGGRSRPFVLGRWRVYHGVWGSGLFQSIYEVTPSLLRSLPMTPDWYLIMATLTVLCGLGAVWPPLLLFAPLLAFSVGVLALTTASNAREALSARLGDPFSRRAALFALTFFLHLLQPLARLRGRLGRGLELTRSGSGGFSAPRSRHYLLWNEKWQDHTAAVADLERELGKNHAVARGGAWDAWDLEIRGGVIGSVRVRTLCEEHGDGRQLLRFLARPRFSAESLGLIGIFGGLALAALASGASVAALCLGGVSALFALRGAFECSLACGSVRRILGRDPRKVEEST